MRCLTLLVLALELPVRAQFGFGCITGSSISGLSPCASEATVFKTSLMHDLEYAKQLLQYAIQVQQLADMVKNSTHAGPNSLTSIQTDLNALAAVVQGGHALAYSLENQDAMFAKTFPGYTGYIPTGGYAARYALWAQTSLDTTQGILRGAGLQGKLVATEMGVLSALRNLASGNLLNRNDAINLTSQLAAEQVGQLQKLRELEIQQMTSVAAYQGYQIQRDSDGVAATQRFFANGPTAGDERTFSSHLGGN